MPLPQNLLALARELVDRNPSAPVEGDLRRGVSTAYYALFHLLVDEATTQIISVPSLRPRVARSFDHRVMKAVCQDYLRLSLNSAGQRVSPAGQIIPPEIRRIASEFVDLQQARHQADYDTSAVITRSQADTDVMRAELTFQDWAVVRGDPAAATFSAELLCRGIPKR